MTGDALSNAGGGGGGMPFTWSNRAVNWWPSINLVPISAASFNAGAVNMAVVMNTPT